MRESYQHQIDAGLVKRYQTLEYEIQSDIVRRIKKARKITSTADWQIERIRILGKSSRDIKKIVASAVQYDDGEVDKLYKQVVADEYTANKSKYEQITGKFVKYEDNLELQQIVAAIDEYHPFDGIHDRFRKRPAVHRFVGHIQQDTGSGSC